MITNQQTYRYKTSGTKSLYRITMATVITRIHKYYPTRPELPQQQMVTIQPTNIVNSKRKQLISVQTNVRNGSQTCVHLAISKTSCEKEDVIQLTLGLHR
jgi:hypothetical protein